MPPSASVVIASVTYTRVSATLPPLGLSLSTGVVGPDRRYVMVIASMQAAGDDTARNTITQAVKTMFPGGRI